MNIREKKLLTLLIITLCALNSLAQDRHLIDSLSNELKVHKRDTTAANILYSLSEAYWGINSDTAINYANQCLNLSEQLDYKKGINDAYNNLGTINSIKGDYVTALEFTKKSLKMAKEMNNKKRIAGAYSNLGIYYKYLGNFSEALKNFSIGLKISEEIGDKSGIAADYNNMADVYEAQGDYPHALKNYFTALKMNEESGKKQWQAINLSNIGRIYLNQGNEAEALKNFFASLKIFEEIGDKNGIANSYIFIGNTYNQQGNYPAAIKKYLASLEILQELGEKNGIAYCYNNIGDVYIKQGNQPEALKNHFASLKIRNEIGDKLGIAMSYLNIGDSYTREKKYNEASEYLNKALLLSKEIGSLEMIKNSYDLFSKLDSAKGNYSKALGYYKLFIAARDSILNNENTKKTVALQMNYDFDKKVEATKVLQEKKDIKQRNIRNSIAGGLALALTFLVVVFRQRNKISKARKRSDELLLNILPEEVAEELKAKGSADAKQFDQVTVMFTDFKGFTRISEKLSPTELVNEIHTCFKAFDEIIGKYNIEKIKTIGDAYMCSGGLPVVNQSHAVDVVSAALEIQQFMQDHLLQRQNEGKDVFEIRIGVHTGPVVAGIVGVKKFAYDIWGDTVNIASRMESSGEAGKVNISGSTYELVKEKFRCEHRGKIQAKNKGEIDMYFVEGRI